MRRHTQRKILFATMNPGKLLEFKKAFEKLSKLYEIISLDDLSYDVPDCTETGSTFKENASLKAENAMKHLKEKNNHMPIIADDSGMSIDGLEGKPGVYTRRWAGYEMKDKEIIDYCLSKMEGMKDRSATYTTCFVLLSPSGEKKYFTGENRGVILQEPNASSHTKGLPFRSLFYIPKLDMMFHAARELDENERKGYSLGHEQAIKEIIEYLDSRQDSV